MMPRENQRGEKSKVERSTKRCDTKVYKKPRNENWNWQERADNAETTIHHHAVMFHAPNSSSCFFFHFIPLPPLLLACGIKHKVVLRRGWQSLHNKTFYRRNTLRLQRLRFAVCVIQVNLRSC